jgi:hypothetical protein
MCHLVRVCAFAGFALLWRCSIRPPDYPVISNGARCPRLMAHPRGDLGCLAGVTLLSQAGAAHPPASW